MNECRDIYLYRIIVIKTCLTQGQVAHHGGEILYGEVFQGIGSYAFTDFLRVMVGGYKLTP